MKRFALVAGSATLVATLAFAGGAEAGSGDTALSEVLSIDYDRNNDIYVAVGVGTSGDIDVWYGQHKSWTKLQENRDIDNRYGPDEFVDFSIGDGDAMYGVAVGNKTVDVNPLNGSSNVDLQPRCTSINAREFSEKPYFGDGKPEVVADDLETCLSIDYDADNDIYVLVGENTAGAIDVYYGQHKSWTKLQDGRDMDNRYTPEEFVDFSIGDGDAMYGVAIGTVVVDVDPRNGSSNVDLQPRCTSINAREFYDKPYFGDGKPKVIAGNLETCLSIDYDADNDNYYVVGANTDGKIDVYYGDNNGWTKLQENRDIDNRYSPAEFVDFSLGAEPGEAMFGVVVGNKADYKVAWRTYEPRGTSINAREFYDKPYFGDGKPKAIG